MTLNAGFLQLPQAISDTAQQICGLHILAAALSLPVVYPGPKLTAITRVLYCHHLVSGRLVYYLHQAHEKYGAVVRVAPNEVLFTSSQAWSDIYGSQQGEPEMSKDTPLYRNFRGPQTIAEAGHDLHRRYRRLLSKGFSGAALREQEHIVQQKIDVLMTQLHAEVANGGTPEMTSWFKFFTFDLIVQLTFGESSKCLENARLHPWLTMLSPSIRFRIWTQALGYYPVLLKLFSRLIPKSYQEASIAHQKLTTENVQRRIERTVSYTDLVSNLIDPKHDLERYDIDGNSSILILAGNETTTTALSATTYYLTQNPEVKTQVTKKVRSTFSSADQITAINVNLLKFLPACFTEAMRIFPPAPAVFSRRVPNEGAYVAGHWIPGGTHVGMCRFATNNSSINFKDPQKYVPERWLGDPEYEDDDRAAMQAFSVGLRNCIGQNLAKLELRLLLSRLIWEFDWELDPASTDWDKDIPAYLAWDMKPLKLRLTPVVR
ncbi:cytochrome P450 monooxygenase [Aspergillus nomiae NRRL 13137]|uniref:Cytochrome P450 monooxygenase n=1 Tax=Aspergillus nomiae NRRL (strain ATCC 15546 / NRRL 13137 / CBS 260.88 / M93) TaxID=1509407 RepID=A0A0L1JFT3_ASPN3|nr:cytochrome P450 monooxygenase [Aspergillus nomiae NRRL 13137]KNG90625.1 cytochrome P450 monooxygenase [Aspergillus nomiae NRRL 13137]